MKVVYLECTSQRALESGTHCSCKRRLPRCQRLDENRNRQLSMDYYGVIQYIYSLHGIISYKPMTTIYIYIYIYISPINPIVKLELKTQSNGAPPCWRKGSFTKPLNFTWRPPETSYSIGKYTKTCQGVPFWDPVGKGFRYDAP